jgi:hypothetical protein
MISNKLIFSLFDKNKLKLFHSLYFLVREIEKQKKKRKNERKMNKKLRFNFDKRLECDFLLTTKSGTQVPQTHGCISSSWKKTSKIKTQNNNKPNKLICQIKRKTKKTSKSTREKTKQTYYLHSDLSIWRQRTLPRCDEGLNSLRTLNSRL